MNIFKYNNNKDDNDNINTISSTVKINRLEEQMNVSYELIKNSLNIYLQ